MTTPRFIAAGLLAAASLITTATAATTIYITGSTAFRSVTNAQIQTILGLAAPTASTNATLGSANAVNWIGGNVGGTPVDVKAAWTGSAAGIQTVAANGGGAPAVVTKFLKDAAAGTSNADPNGATPDSPDSRTPDICMSDIFQSSSPFIAGRSIVGGGTYLALTDTTVAVVSFTFAASNGFPAGLSMNPKTMVQQFSGIGAIPIGAYSGNLADTPDATFTTVATSVVYATGRNPISGSRINALAETGYGTGTLVSQLKPTSSGLNGNISAMTFYPVETINGIGTGAVGNSGENSGGNLRNFLTNTLLAGAFQNGEPGPSYLITYLGVSDFNSVKTGAAGITKPAVEVAWNGVTFTQDRIKTGLYTFWSYEHIMWRSTLGNGTTGGPAVKLTFANSLKTNILAASSATLSPNVALSDMRVNRSGDGGPISNPNF